ncbi:MAG TPA: bifunctional metallophosphatase/5'-nucleotidase [Marmoricola sp.]|nr:bifunctional metallophosphatase/5'-nucleotidase [Marmoricola sp.]
MTTRLPRRLLGVLAAGACALAGAAAVQPAPASAATHDIRSSQQGPLMPLQILSFNDFHGNLEPPSGSSGRLVTGHHLDPTTGDPVNETTDVGGVAYLASHLAQARQGHPNTLTVAAGDIIGASPLLSAAFHDEPTIEAMNKLGLDATAVGNHEFDEGYKELQRMQYGGCIDDGDGANNQNSCPDHVFQGASFDYLAANVKYAGTDRTILPAYTIKDVNGARIGFIGMTLHDTPTIVTASGVAGLQFTDEVKTANALVPVLESQGVKAIVVLIHQGGVPGQQTWFGPDNKPYQVSPSYDAACAHGSALAPDSPIIPIAQQLSPQIDMVISGHTHQPYVCDIPDPAGHDRMVTSASSFGRLFTDTEMTYDRRTQDIVRSSVVSNNELVTRGVTPDAGENALIATYKELVRPIASKVIGHITDDVTRASNPAGESVLGDLIADAQLADPSVVTNGEKPVIAFMNPGGIRADLTYANSPYGEAPGDVTFDEAFTVQPFNNYLVSMTLTGQDIYDLLAQQVTGRNAGTASKTLQVSHGFTYEMSPTGPVDGSVALDGTPIDRAATYRIVTNNFLADGGDNFPAFTHGTGRYFGGLDIDAFAHYLTAQGSYTPVPPTRISGSK